MLANAITIRLLGGVFIFFSLFIGSLKANTDVDSLLTVIKDRHTEVENILNDIKTTARQYRAEHPLFALRLLDEGIQIAEQSNRDTTIAYFHFLKGRIQKRIGKKEDAWASYLQAKHVYTEINHNSGITNTINELGWVEVGFGNYKKARVLFEEALSFSILTNKPLLKAVQLNDIGVTYHYQKAYQKATEFYLQATRIREAEGNKSGLVISYNNLGLIYKLRKDYYNAFQYYQKGLVLAEERQDLRRIISLNTNLGNLRLQDDKLEAALDYFKIALEIALEYKSQSRIAFSQFNIGRVYNRQALYPQAINHLKECINIFEELKERQHKATALFELGKARYHLGQTKKGLHLMSDAIRLEEQTNATSISNYKYIADIYYQEGRYAEGYNFLKNYLIFKDSTESIEVRESIAGLQIQFDEEFKLKEKEKEIALLDQAQSYQKKRFHLTFVFLLVISVFAIGLIWNLWQKTKINLLLNQQYSKLHEQKEKLLLINAEKEKAVQVAEKAAKVKEEFLTSMSHEIRTPMNAVIGITNLLIDESPRQDQLENLRTLQFSSKSLLGIINDILDFSKIESGNITFEQIDFSVKSLLENIIETFNAISNNKGIVLKLEGDSHTLKHHLKGDPTRLTQIFTNLLGNAIKFTSEGSVILMAKVVEYTNTQVDVYFEVRDTGIGIPKNKIDNIFESFTQAADDTTRLYGGTGLGLTITKKLIALQGGSIKVKSIIGEGSTFYFTLKLPLGKPLKHHNANALVSNISSRKGLEGCSILLAEDNKINQLVAKKILSKWKIKLDIANDGVEVLEKLAIKNYDLILMDIQMPRMDGFEATKKIREEMPSPKKDIPIIALTASAIHLFAGDNKDNFKMNDYVCKPFNPEHLFDKIYGQLEGVSMKV